MGTSETGDWLATTLKIWAGVCMCVCTCVFVCVCVVSCLRAELAIVDRDTVVLPPTCARDPVYCSRAPQDNSEKQQDIALPRTPQIDSLERVDKMVSRTSNTGGLSGEGAGEESKRMGSEGPHLRDANTCKMGRGNEGRDPEI